MLNTKLRTVVEELGAKLKARGWRLVTAESCTGGGLAYWLTSVPGSSEWYDRGYITYSDFSKTQVLGVNFRLIEQFGAVSEQVALEMAERSLSISSAHLSIAITGIAGPTGGSLEKPLGYTWIALASKHFKSHTECHVFSGERSSVREQAIFRAVEQLFLMI